MVERVDIGRPGEDAEHVYDHGSEGDPAREQLGQPYAMEFGSSR